jgi:hypothetical protein
MLEVISMTYYYDGTTSRRWHGVQVNQDNISSDTYMPYVGNFNHAWDAQNDNWDRMTGTDITLSWKDVFALFTYNANMFYVPDAWQDWVGAQMNSDAVAATTAAPWVGNFGHFYQTDATNWARRSGETADGGDIAATVDAAYNFNLTYGWNGATWSAVPTTANGGLQVGLEEWHPAYDAGNDWVAEYKKDIAVYNPAATAGTAVDDAGTDVVCASTYVLNLPNWTVMVKNAGGGSADAFSDVDVQVSYDETTWASLTSTACDSLASGVVGVCYEASAVAYPYVRVVAACGVGDDTTADCKIMGNKN